MKKIFYKKKELKKFDKFFVKGYHLGIIIGLITALLIFLIFILFLHILSVDSIYFTKINNFLNNQQTKAYEFVSEHWKYNKFVESLSYICSLQKTELEKVKCVHYYINSTFNYTEHDWGNKLRSPEETITFGGVCRDFSVLYSSIFKNLNIDYEFVHKPRHIYLLVYPDDYICKLDMRYFECLSKKQ